MKCRHLSFDSFFIQEFQELEGLVACNIQKIVAIDKDLTFFAGKDLMNFIFR